MRSWPESKSFDLALKTLLDSPNGGVPFGFPF